VASTDCSTMHKHLTAFQTYLEVERHASPHTVRNYLSDLQQFCTFAGEHCGRELDTPEQNEPGLIRAFLTTLHTQGAEHTTLARKLSSLRSFLRFVEGQGAVAGNAARGVRMPKTRRSLPKVLSIDQVFVLLDTPATPPAVQYVRDQAILELLYATGIRVSELVDLNVTDVDLTSGTLRVRGKGKRERQVFFGKTASAALNAYLQSRPQPHRTHEDKALFL